MNSTPLVSIVVPVYNSEKYLDNCIQSILFQTYTNFELILINDGSTDNSKKICDKYLSLDNRVKVYNKENGGVSSARNVGIDMAEGHYLMFVDSDDTVCKTILEELIINIDNNVDFIISPVTQKHILNNRFYTKNELFSLLFKKEFSSFCFGSPFGKLFLLKYIKEKNIKYDKNMSYAEDLQFNMLYLLCCNKIKTIDKCYYNYNTDNQNSLSTKFRINNYYDVLKNFELKNNIISNLNLNNELYEINKNRLIEMFNYFILQSITTTDKEECFKYFELLSNDEKYLTFNKKNILFKILAFLIKKRYFNLTYILCKNIIFLKH